MADLTINKILSRVAQGDIRIPSFQRDFVWDPEQVAFLLDSIYKNFPIGTVVLWKTKEKLQSEKKLGSFTLPEPEEEYPVNYVLDGQQRITSIFSAFQNTLTPEDDNWVDIYLDMEASSNPQEVSFVALEKESADPNRHFPVNTFYDSTKFFTAMKAAPEDKISFIESVSFKFRDFSVPTVTFETDDRNEVAIVFERINRAGTELNTFELLTAWSWSDDFDLIEKFENLQREIENAGFASLVDDRDLQLRICAAVITGETAAAKILELQGEEIRQRFSEIRQGILGAIDFLQREIGVKHYRMLPFPAALVPLSCFFATDKADGQKYNEHQKNSLKKWFWISTLSRRFSNDVTARQAFDIAEMRKLKSMKDHKFSFPSYERKIDFDKNKFSASSGNSRALILMLASKHPKSFLSGANIVPDSVLKKGSAHEFHHIFPKNHLKNSGVGKDRINILANICFLTRHDNNEIKDKSPIEYFDKIPKKSRDDILSRALVNYDDADKDYEDFIRERTQKLNLLADTLAGQ